MRKLLTTLAASFLVAFSAQAQIVINEIMYNIPGTGEDQEYIELYNAGATAVTLNGYEFSQGIIYTFPVGGATISIPATGYYVIARDSAGFASAFGNSPDAVWTSGGLSNSGEDITLLDASGNTVDSVDYDDAMPWPLDADGGGYALQLCDPNTDNNLAANWGISNNFIGFNTQSGVDSLFGTPGTMNTCIVILPPPPRTYPLYTIDDVDGVDATGVADSSGVTCELRGIVHCVDFDGDAGYDFRMANSNGTGIRIFSFNDVNGYTVMAGDSIHVWGEVGQFRGNLQFTPDSITVVSTGNMTVMPMLVTQLDETTENRYVTLENMMLVDPAEWTGTGTGFNVRITSMGSTDTFTMRIDDNVDLYSQPAPGGVFSITGWGGQFDFAAPFDEGYQLLPCGSAQLVNVNEPIVPALYTRLYPNPARQSLTVESSATIETLIVYNTLGQIVLTKDNVAANSIQINTANLDNGMYTATVVAGQQVTTKLFRVAK